MKYHEPIKIKRGTRFVLTVLLFTFLIGFKPADAQVPWEWLHPWPTGADLFDVKAFSSGGFIAVGKYSTILYKNSAEDSMTVSTNVYGKNLRLNNVFFLNEEVGWACGWYGGENKGIIIKTTNGGRSWEILFSTEVFLPKGVYFLNDQIGWTFSYYNDLFKTTDGGRTWEKIYELDAASLKDIYFMDADTGIIIGDSKSNSKATIYRTTNGGKDWTPLSFDSYTDLLHLSFPASCGGKLGWVVGIYGTVLKTSDYGQTWQQLSTGDNKSYNTVCFLNDTLGWIASPWGNVVAKTKDGGITWEPVATNVSFFSIDFSDEMHGIGVGFAGTIAITDDGGITWKYLNKCYTTNYLSLLYFFPHDSVWALGRDGVCLSSSDKGKTWKPHANTGYDTPNGITFSTPDTGWIVRSSFYYPFYWTTDSGKTWEPFWDVKDTGPLYDVTFLNHLTGFIVGYQGAFLKTTDGGRNWQKIEIGTSEDLFKIVILNENNILIIGKGGSVFRSEDGGNSWNKISLTDKGLSACYFLNENIGWLVSGQGKMWQTSDGGTTWFDGWDVPQSMSKILFRDEERGWCIIGTEIQETIDGGKTWKSVLEFESLINCPYNFYLVNQDTMLIIGENGFIGQLDVNNLTNIKRIDYLVPKSAFLYQNYPNPFNPATTIEFRLPTAQLVSLTIYNVLGQKVRTLVNQRMGPGLHSVRWNGRNDLGHAVSSGVYLYRLQAGQTLQTKKMLLVR